MKAKLQGPRRMGCEQVIGRKASGRSLRVFRSDRLHNMFPTISGAFIEDRMFVLVRASRHEPDMLEQWSGMYMLGSFRVNGHWGHELSGYPYRCACEQWTEFRAVLFED